MILKGPPRYLTSQRDEYHGGHLLNCHGQAAGFHINFNRVLVKGRWDGDRMGCYDVLGEASSL